MKKYKIYLCFTLFLIFFSEIKLCSAVPQDSLGNHLWYIEFAGANFGISFNYEYILLKDTSLKIRARTGIGGNFFFFLRYGSPLMINFIFGKEYCLDLGVGILFDYFPKQVEYDYSTQAIKFIGNIGYRYIGDGGYLFKIGFTPIYFADRGIIPLFGISFGHYF